jgi:hypothetical protein
MLNGAWSRSFREMKLLSFSLLQSKERPWLMRYLINGAILSSEIVDPRFKNTDPLRDPPLRWGVLVARSGCLLVGRQVVLPAFLSTRNRILPCQQVSISRLLFTPVFALCLQRRANPTRPLCLPFSVLNLQPVDISGCPLRFHQPCQGGLRHAAAVIHMPLPHYSKIGSTIYERTTDRLTGTGRGRERQH